MTQKARGSFKFKIAWSFPEPVEKRIATFINKHPGVWLHAPVGISKLEKGEFNSKTTMYTLDINPDVKPDCVCDIFKMTKNDFIISLVKKHGGFTGVVSDPLWYFSEICPKCGYKITNRTKGLAYPQRRHLSFQIRQVLKPDGWWLFNGLWNPRVKGLAFADPKTNPIGAPIEVPMQAFSSFRNVSLLCYMKKVNQTLV